MRTQVLNNKVVRGGLVTLTGLTLLAGFGGQVAVGQTKPGPFADPALQRVWQRTDLPVAEGRVNRTWLWGPTPGVSIQEPFKEGKGGTHLAQYFDKARMEINYPDTDPFGPYYVTNGLLVVEMISGQIQTGINQFESSAASDQRIAGDEGSDAPTYASLQGVASVGLPGGEHRADRVTLGTALPARYANGSGNVSDMTAPNLPPETVKAAAYVNETGHNIPDVFWAYMNSQGPVYENGAYFNGPLMNWVSALGFPVTEPYWTRIRVAGNDRLVLFQAFQRRVLTYSPGNPAGWKVEMGNVGAQYYSWRYETPALSCARVPVRGFGRVWADNRSVQRGLGCPQNYPPFEKEQTIQTAYQPFEHGAMLWVNRTTYTQERLIYVFFDDGTFQQFDDTWREGDPLSDGLTPPPGLYEPVRGFGKVWREGTGARVRERLGWATAVEKGGQGAYQRFQQGEMYWSGAVNKIWVLYGTVSDYQYPAPTPVAGGTPYHYDVFYDAFNP